MPKDMAKITVFLVSEDDGWVTSEDLIVGLKKDLNDLRILMTK